jgi:hypothetical protein
LNHKHSPQNIRLISVLSEGLSEILVGTPRTGPYRVPPSVEASLLMLLINKNLNSSNDRASKQDSLEGFLFRLYGR